MKLRTIVVFFFLISFAFPAFAQQVSTLINDPDREFAAMHWHEDGRIYSVDYFQGRLYQIHLDGTVETLVSGFSNLAGGGFDKQGNFYFAAINAGEICRLNADNSYTVVASGFNQPVGILAHPTDDDILFVSEFGNNKLTQFSISTSELTPFVSGNGINGPDAIIYGWANDFIVSNWNNHKIHTVDIDGNVNLLANVPSTGFMGYVDKIGDYLYVPSFSGKKLYRIDMTGEVQLIAGTGVTGHIDGEGTIATFTSPNGTCHNTVGDTLLVSDDHRIRIITDFAPVVNTIAEPLLQNITVSPNPVSDILNISAQVNQRDNIEWTIKDLEGRMHKSGKIASIGGDILNLEIPIEEFVAGFYVIHFKSRVSTAIHSFVKVKR